MAVFPKIQSPCPYKDEAYFPTMLDGDFCRLCTRQVVDLGGWSDEERMAFLAGCTEEVCVSYKLPLRTLAAAALTAGMAMMPASAAAQDAVVAPVEPGIEASQETMVLTIGAIRDVRAVEYVETAQAGSRPELPVIYEEETPPPVPAQDSDRGPGAI
jgi:hypothetical protein